MYLPTSPMRTASAAARSRSTSASHSREVGRRRLDAEVLEIRSSTPSALEVERDLVDRVHVARGDDGARPAGSRTARSSRGSRARGRSSERQTSMSGWMPISAQLLDRVLGRLGLELAGVARGTARASRARTCGGRGPGPTWNWRSASRNGSDSMSPTVPPISVITTSTSADSATQPDAVLDLVGDVRDHLHRAAEVVAAALAPDHGVVDRAGGHVRRARGVRRR